jgi:hypothetical protein
LKPITGNESLHKLSNDNWVRGESFAISKNSTVRVQCSHIAASINTWTSSDGKTLNQIHHIIIDRWKHSSALAIWSFRAAYYDTDDYLVVAKIRERQQWINKYCRDFIWRSSISRS